MPSYPPLGKMNESLVIMRKNTTATRDALGGVVEGNEAYVPYRNIRGAVVPIKGGGDVYKADQIQNVNMYRVSIWYNTDLLDSDRLVNEFRVQGVKKVRDMEIVRIDDRYNKGMPPKFMDILCKEEK